jgi:GDP-L-fucose synthase
MKKVLILGSTGFLGKHIFEFLSKLNIFGLESQTFHPTREDFNLLSYESLQKYNLQLDKKFDYIFNCAIYFKPGNFNNEAEHWIYNQTMNSNFLRYIWEFQRQATVATFGTDASYPAFSDKSESEYLRGIPSKDYFSYALTKRNLYEGLLSIHEQDYMFNFFHFPIISLYGTNYKKDDDHLIHSILRKIVRGKLYNEEVSFWGSGEQIREIVYIDDLIKNIFYILNMTETEDFIYNLGSDKKKLKIKDYVKIICDLAEYDYNKVIFNKEQTRGLNSKTLDNIHAKREMMFYEDTEFEKSILEPLNYSFKLYK